MLALPKISLHGAGAIADMVNLAAGKQWGKALIVTDGQRFCRISDVESAKVVLLVV